MRCMSHRTKNRMKPNTAIPCMASSRRAMSVRAGSRVGRSPSVGDGEWFGSTEVVFFRVKSRPPTDTSAERQEPVRLTWTRDPAEACADGHGGSFTVLPVPPAGMTVIWLTRGAAERLFRVLQNKSCVFPDRRASMLLIYVPRVNGPGPLCSSTGWALNRGQ